MQQHSWFKAHWKLTLNIVTIVALAALIFALRDPILETLENIKKVNGWALLLLVPLAALNYHAQTKLYQGMFKVVGNKLSYWFLYKTALELNFVNHVFPSGGVTGISYFSLRLKGVDNISASKATLVHAMKLVLQFLSFILVLGIAMVALVSKNQISNITVMVAATLTTLLVVGTLLFMYLAGSQQRINAFFISLTRGLNRLIQFVRPGYHPETINITKAHQAFDEFHHNYKAIRHNLRQLKWPFFYAFLANATEIAAIYAVYVAFDQFVNIGAIILGYAVANFAGLVSVLPGGVGIYEALMTGVLATAGIPPRISLPATVMFRVISTLIQVPIGYYFYQKAIHKGGLSSHARH